MSESRPSKPAAGEPATVRIAMWSARHRWPVAALWFVVTIGLLVVSLSMGGINAADADENPNERQLEASEAYDVFNAGGTNDPFEQVIVVIGGAPGATGDPAFTTAVGDVVAQLRAASAPLDGVQTPTFDQLTDPLSAPPEAGLVSPDGSTVRIVGRIEGDDTRVVPLIAPVLPLLDGARAANPGLAIHAISSTFINDDINALISEGLDDSLRLTIPLTFIILLFAFGAIVASVVPLVLAITSLIAAFGILGIYSQIVGAGQPERDPADRAHRPRRGGRLLAVHDHPLPGRTAGRPRPGQGDRGLEQHRRPRGLLLGAGGHDLARRADHPRRLAVHVDGDRDDLGRLRVGRRQPDVPAGDAVDPRRPGQPRAPGGLAAAARGGGADRAGPALGPVRPGVARPSRGRSRRAAASGVAS